MAMETEGKREVSERIVLGATDIRVSPMGIGTWQWGDRLVWNYGTGEFNDADLQAGFERALIAGINFFDTAETYGSGHSEMLLGQFLRRALQEGKAAPDVVIIATKFMPYPWRLSPKELFSSLKRSLKRLDIDHIDLYQIHHPLPPHTPETWAACLADVASEGLVRAVGVSNYSEDWTRRAFETLAKRGIPLASNQVEYNLLMRDPEWNGILKACRELKITLIAHTPLARGLLTGKYTPDNPPKGVRRFQASRNLKSIQPLIHLMFKFGQEHGGKTPGQVALNWLINKGAMPIPGIKNFRQAEENCGALGWHLTADEVSQLDEFKLSG
jgi:aryl-alcohol dehydrogenase-like predicted oxidoreductase